MTPIHDAHGFASGFCNTNTQVSLPSPLERESISSIFEKIILTWLPPSTSFLGDSSAKWIHLIKKAESYRVRIVDYLFFKVHKEISLDLPQELVQQPEEDVVHYLKKFTVSDEAELDITEQLEGYPIRKCGTQELALRSSKGRLLWFLYDAVENSASWSPVSNNDANILLTISGEERGKLFKNYTVKIVARNGRLQDVFLSKAFAKSKLDPSKTLDENSWTITLISTGRSSETDTGCGHAKIVYETFQRGIHSLFYAHLTAVGASPGYAKVQIGQLPLNAHIKYRHKSPTWIKSPDSVMQMMEALDTEKETALAFVQTGNPGFIGYLRGHPAYLAGFLTGVWLESLVAIGLKYATVGSINVKQDILFGIGYMFMRVTIPGRKYAEDRSSTENSHQILSYNCLTWAVKKIRLAGVDLPLIHDMIAVPDRYISSLS